jgi:flagellar assembly factor FliW
MTGTTTFVPRSTTKRLATPFGTFEISSDQVVTFPSGVPGFEECRRFVVLSAPDIAPMQCLHAVEGPATSFLVVDPRQVLPDYRAVLTPTDLMRLGAGEDHALLLWLAVVSIDPEGTAFVNLRAPIVINPERMLGYQVMPHNSLYPLRHPLDTE